MIKYKNSFFCKFFVIFCVYSFWGTIQRVGARVHAAEGQDMHHLACPLSAPSLPLFFLRGRAGLDRAGSGGPTSLLRSQLRPPRPSDGPLRCLAPFSGSAACICDDIVTHGLLALARAGPPPLSSPTSAKDPDDFGDADRGEAHEGPAPTLSPIGRLCAHRAYWRQAMHVVGFVCALSLPVIDSCFQLE
jgi:hypothetical protein